MGKKNHNKNKATAVGLQAITNEFSKRKKAITYCVG